jgi:hypothetical protein
MRSASRATVLGTFGALLSACVLADPPPTLPLVAELPPTITDSVVPSEGLLLRWPAGDRFEIPVSLLDPSIKVHWIALVDGAFQRTGDNSQDSPNDAGVSTLNVTVSAPTGPGCHTVSIVVAYDFATGSTVPDSQGGDSAEWYYNPNGTCSGYDAGALNDASFPDTGHGG